MAIARLASEFDAAPGGRAKAHPEDIAAETDFTAQIPIAQIPTELARLSATRDALTADLDRQTLRIAIVGAPLVGKSAIARELRAALPAPNTPDTPEIDWSEIAIRAAVGDAAGDPQNDSRRDPQRDMLLADCVLYTIGGDLTASERGNIERLVEAGQTVIVAWNARDPRDADRVLGSIHHQLADLVRADRICQISAASATSGDRPEDEVERLQKNEAIAPLRDLVQSLDRAPLVWQQTQRAANFAIADLCRHLNALRRHRAAPLVRRYQWLAATATIANPIPSLDLLASGSVGAQMLVDLGKIYHRDLSLARARVAFDAIAEMLLKLGLVELSTQAIAGVLKHNPITFVAGSAVQGLSAAYLTYAIGETAIRYFETQDTESFDALREKEASASWDWPRFQAILTQTMAQTRRVTVMKAWIAQAAAAIERPVRSAVTTPDVEGAR